MTDLVSHSDLMDEVDTVYQALLALIYLGRNDQSQETLGYQLSHLLVPLRDTLSTVYSHLAEWHMHEQDCQTPMRAAERKRRVQAS